MFDPMTLHRTGRFLRDHKIPLLPAILTRLMFHLDSCIIPYDVEFGAGTRLAYGGMGILIVKGTVIGENCVIGVNCAIVRKHPYKNVPLIGDRVYVGAGAIIAGPVIIEDDVIVAPNSVVTKSVRRYSIVGGVTAKIIGDVRNLDYDVLNNPKYKDGNADYLA